MAKKGKLTKVAKGLQNKAKESSRVCKKTKPASNASRAGSSTTSSRSHVQTFGAELSQENVILLVGEGNFSFAASLAEKLTTGSNILATSYDSQETLCEKYTDASEKTSLLVDYDATVLYGVDATMIHKEKRIREVLKTKMGIHHGVPDRIIFNFPHVGMGIKDQERNVRANQGMLLSFFQSCLSLIQAQTEKADMVPVCQIWVTLKTGSPYDQWDLKGLAKSAGLKTHTSFPFDPSAYPGYAHRRTIGFKEGVSSDDNIDLHRQPCRTYVFIEKQQDSEQ